MTATATREEALQNHLFAGVSDEELARLMPNLQLVSLPLGQVLYESGEKMDYVYFPTTAIISLLYIMENGSSAEIGVVGNDGLVGIAIFMGGDTTPNRAVVQSAGKTFKMKAEMMKDEFTRGGRFHNRCMRYTQALITQISQTAVCNRLHSVDQQLCRWLLLSHDRLPSDRLIMTQDLIANMLGVRREGITHAAKRLQEAGYISYVRGDMTILDRKGLESGVCECYQVVRTEYDRLLGSDSLTPAVHTVRLNIKGKAVKFLMMTAMALSLALTPLYGIAQQNNNTSTGQMKESGTEVGRAGKSMARHVRHGRVLRGGKHFGKHVGRAGKHFGRGTKKAVKHVIS